MLSTYHSFIRVSITEHVNISQELVGPLTQILDSLSAVVWDVISKNMPKGLQWQIILLTIFIATVFWMRRKGRGSKNAPGYERPATLVSYILPTDIYTHISARVDIWLWITERTLRPLWAIGLFAMLGPSTETVIIQLLETTIGSNPGVSPTYM
jgi:hypothetical protein